MISIVIPVFNQPEYVRSMIDSIINQSYKDWELLLIDDGSDEATISILKEFAVVDDRISLFQRPKYAPKGAQTCRNIGLSKAKGEYIIFYDSDDILYQDALQQRIKFMQDNLDIDFAVFPFSAFSNDLSDLSLKSGFDLSQDDLFYFICGTTPFLVVTNIYRLRSLRSKSIIWDDALKGFQDADFNIQCICSGMKFKYAEGATPDYYVRLLGNQHSISKKIASAEQVESHIHFIEKLYNYNLPSKYNCAIYKRIQYVVIRLLNSGYTEFDLFLKILKDRGFYLNYGMLRFSICSSKFFLQLNNRRNRDKIIKIFFCSYYFIDKIHDYKIKKIKIKYEKYYC